MQQETSLYKNTPVRELTKKDFDIKAPKILLKKEALFLQEDIVLQVRQAYT